MNVNTTPHESWNESTRMIMEYQQNGSKELATKLIQKYEPIVKMAAGKISRNRPDLYEDLNQVGQMAMIRLLQQYDAQLGVPFEPYAMKSIIGHMKNFLRDKSWYLQVPRRIKEKGATVQLAIDELTVKLERSPRVEEIADYLELSEEETLEILAGRECYHYVSLDSPISQEESAATLGEMISSEVDDYDTLEKRMDLLQALGELQEQEKQVLLLAFEEGQSQRAIAQKLGVSQMSISRIQRRATEKLKQMMSSNNQVDYID
ncbi:sigma-70 family RNA polymerase sigma factor [Paenibacillus motobuensis]|uniref:sigma-70 family RNA polymerase sigma factor n=1 Tax=Paenibacillus TaxID=44249 RepID=UPI00203D6AB3|nr:MULTISPECIES: sigma-70 family RNA polymerase sigma factor [Paenibacillus]MCM3041980.1 sigma-70 family RNA polymerase sigma factor [Paenibacillus lutimineralis]MCM3649084.1 sigma-70 family RNA polymerase sigma factor [Paenibacillus motobuensis]